MEHTNSIAIQVLNERYHDYPANAWHYDDEYRLIVRALKIQKEGQFSEYSIQDNRILRTNIEGV